MAKVTIEEVRRGHKVKISFEPFASRRDGPIVDRRFRVILESFDGILTGTNQNHEYRCLSWVLVGRASSPSDRQDACPTEQRRVPLISLNRPTQFAITFENRYSLLGGFERGNILA
jgi:hypothetical protein